MTTAKKKPSAPLPASYRFSEQKTEARSVMIQVRLTPSEAKAVDGLIGRLGIEDGRSGLFRRALDAFVREVNAPTLE
jgi:hypothetical protein